MQETKFSQSATGTVDATAQHISMPKMSQEDIENDKEHNYTSSYDHNFSPHTNDLCKVVLRLGFTTLS
jgi:hypothetical protein